MIEIPQRAALLSRTHLFNGLSEEQLNAVAAELEEASFKTGEEIVVEGQEGNLFFLIVSGKVRVTRKENPKPLATLVAGDYFGEESMLVSQHRRTATVTAVDETFTLVLKKEHFQGLLKQARGLRANFLVAVNSRRLARRSHFKWLPEDEVIYYLARKHPILLIRALIVPSLLLLMGLAGLLVTWYYADRPEMQALWWVALVVSIFASLWALWNGIDWGNDYYILTNRRVIWLEKVVGIYDSRNEAPLSAVQRINVQTEFWGRQLEYGNLVVRTIVGSTLTLQNISYPFQAAALIEEHWKRSQETTRKMEQEDLKQALRERLLKKDESRPVQLPSLIAKPQAKADPYKGKRRLADLFRLRFEDKSVVTYRKHIVVLARQTWRPFLIILVLVAVFIYTLTRHLLSEASTLELDSLLCLWSLLFGAAFFWWLYQYIDWSNDIFQVTPEQILDIDKTPLGEMTSDIAALDNILSIEYERHGLWELLFNYGNVMITIGGGKQMVFEDVANPSAVQDDIERRRLERISKREQDKARAERERFVDWFSAYYDNEQDIRAEGAAQKSDEAANPPDKNETTGGN